MALRLSARFFRNSSKIRLFSQQSCYCTVNSTEEAGEYADIVISGGGMVGGAMACALGKKFLKN